MKKIVVDSRKDFIRAAVTEDGELTEVIIEDRANISETGNIYVGIVKNILPSQFAFIDIGIGRNVFLHLKDIKESHLFNNGKLNLRQGDNLLVQIMKDASGTKAANATSQISLTGRYMVVIKNDFSYADIGISKKIENKNERDRLKKIAAHLLKTNYGLILRTSSEAKTEEELAEEFNELYGRLENISGRWKYLRAPCAVHRENSEVVKMVKELYQSGVSEIILNNQEDYEKLRQNENYFSGADCKFVYYNESADPVFSRYGIESQFKKAASKKVWLNSGGFIIIEQTEACAVIDVNTGKFVGKKGHLQTVQKTNVEALEEIAKQIQLRNLSGVIIIDFIDMKDAEKYAELIGLMQALLNRHRIRGTVVSITELGLMQITRKKIREPLNSILTTKCHCCDGDGVIRQNKFFGAVGNSDI